MDNIIEVEGLRKSYGDLQAVRGIDFSVRRGELFAFLGPNGAGKSTTIDMICTFLRPDGGRVTVDGFALGREDNAIRRIIGAVFQTGLLDDLLTIEENLKSRGGFYGLRGAALDEAVRRAADTVGVTALLKRPYGKLSGGQRRRCDIARALIHTPKILFLDEPTTGLDPQTRKNVWETITELQRRSEMTIFLTTHYMEEAAQADHVVIIDEGQLVARGTPAELKERYSSDRLVLVCPQPESVAALLRGRGYPCTLTADTVQTVVQTTMEALPLLEACKEQITGFEVVRGTMDDVFLTITGKEIRA